MTPTIRSTALLGVLMTLTLIGCAGSPTSTPTSSQNPNATVPPTLAPTSAPTPGPTGGGPINVTSAAQAAALVFASDERWAQMTPLRPDLIGQSTWFETVDNGDGYSVNITVGAGDCEAGCIEHHTWQYSVDKDGKVELVGETGDSVQPPLPAGGAGPAQLTAQLTSGPVCPVERNPPDPNCAPRAVANAELTVYDPRGNAVASGISDPSGMVTIEVPAGAYYVVAQDVEGLMGSPEAQAFAVLGGGQVGLLFQYDTGIR
jgi:hypothetical protein